GYRQDGAVPFGVRCLPRHHDPDAPDFYARGFSPLAVPPPHRPGV
ncbi:hypothetical protein, partial [Pseudomonas sp. FEN]